MVYKKHALVKIGNVCNNNCIGCSISSGQTPRKEYDCKKIKKEILDIKKAGFESIELIGGEVTIEKDFFELLSFCNKHFKEVCLVTNGRILFYTRFVKKLIKSCPGLNIEIAIHGHDSKTHDAFTRVQGSFQQTITGLKNILKYRRYFGVIGINTLITQLNKDKIRNILELIKKFPGITEWYLLTFVPVKGRALKNSSFLIPRYSKIKDLNNIVKDASKILDCVDLNEFPYCMFDEEVVKNSKIHFIDSDKIEYDKKGVITSFNPTFSFNEADYISNISFKKYIKKLKKIHSSFRTKDLTECKVCKYKKNCGGVWKYYITLFGKKEVNNEFKKFKKYKKKVLFITLDAETLDNIYPLQIAYLISYSKKSPKITENYNFEIINEKIKKVNLENYSSLILARKPDIICFSAYLWSISIIEQLAKKIKEKNKHIKILVGGPQADTDLVNKPYFDFIVIGEGEVPFKDVLENDLNKNNLLDKKGLCFNFGNKTIFNGKTELNNLDEIPSPFLSGIFNLKNFNRIYFETMRGCPYDCAFCSEKLRGSNTRFFNLKRIKKELTYILSNSKNYSIEIIDNNFNLVRPRCDSIISMIEKLNYTKKNIQVSLNHGLLEKKDIPRFKKAGINKVEIGLQTINRKAYLHLNRPELNLKEFKEKIACFDETFTIFINLIIGLPGDDYRGFSSTINFLTQKLNTKAKIKIDSELLKILPGTTFANQIRKFKLRFEKNPLYNISSNYSFSEKDILKALKLDQKIRKRLV